MIQPLLETSTGIPCYGGLITPQSRESGFRCYADEEPMLTRDEIRRIISDKNRVPAVKRFPDRTWIQRQVNNGCNGFACAAALGRARVARGCKPVVLSGDFVYAHINGGSDQGSMLADGMRFILETGAAPDSMVRVGTWRARDITPAAKEAAKRFRALEAYAVDTEDELLSGLALGFMGVVAVHVGSGFDARNGDVVAPSNGPGNHSVCVDDVRERDGKLEIRLPNSWGPQWAVNGAGWISWENHLNTSVRYHQFFLVRTTVDDPLEAA